MSAEYSVSVDSDAKTIVVDLGNVLYATVRGRESRFQRAWTLESGEWLNELRQRVATHIVQEGYPVIVFADRHSLKLQISILCNSDADPAQLKNAVERILPALGISAQHDGSSQHLSPGFALHMQTPARSTIWAFSFYQKMIGYARVRFPGNLLPPDMFCFSLGEP